MGSIARMEPKLPSNPFFQRDRHEPPPPLIKEPFRKIKTGKIMIDWVCTRLLQVCTYFSTFLSHIGI